MRILLAAVGRAKGHLAPAIHEYEARIRRYFPFDSVEIKEASARSSEPSRVREEEGKRLLSRIGSDVEVVAMHREGDPWTSVGLARYLSGLSVDSRPGAAFLIGGAYGLSDEVLTAARLRISISGFTLPHELARLVLAEQLYRAGTIIRGEPYHKIRGAE